jgi:inositol-1,3,4-trisphosphate 5/6-kinase/inositol-tetrakisphosphate 1-kinase
MAIVTSHIGLRRIQYPCILQEYTNHDGILYKVYVLGNKVWVFPRSSLPNLPLVQCTLDDHDDNCDGLTSVVDVDMSKHYVEFDSQCPYPTSSDFEVLNDDTATSSTTPQVKNPFALTSSSSHLDDDNPRPHHDNKNIQKMNTVLSDNLSLAITSQEIKPVASRLRDAFGLDMFGFDVLLCSSSSSSVSILDETISTSDAVKEMFVVDVNYFPSYKEVSNFPQLLAQYLAQCAIEGKNRS